MEKLGKLIRSRSSTAYDGRGRGEGAHGSTNASVTVYKYIDIMEDKASRKLTFAQGMQAESICEEICGSLHIGALGFPLFALQDAKTKQWLSPNDTVEANSSYYFRCRFKPSGEGLKTLAVKGGDDKTAYYYFLQCRADFLSDEYKLESDKANGLALVDCLRVMHEENLSANELLNKKYSLRKFLPKSDGLDGIHLNRNRQFIARLHEESRSANNHGNNGVCLRFVKNGLWNYIPDFGVETFLTDDKVELKVDCKGITQTDNTYRPASRLLFSIDDIVTIDVLPRYQAVQRISIATSENTYEFTFSDLSVARSFVSCVEGMCRLCVCPSIEVCSDSYSPRQKAYNKKHIHGPASDGWIKKCLESKRNDFMYYILTQHHTNLTNIVFSTLDPRTHRRLHRTVVIDSNFVKFEDEEVEHLTLDGLIKLEKEKFNRDNIELNSYRTKEDDPRLLLCREDTYTKSQRPGELGSFASAGCQYVPNFKLYIQRREIAKGEHTIISKATVLEEESRDKVRDVAIKQLAPTSEAHLQTLLDSINRVAFWSDRKIVRIFEMTLARPCQISMEYAEHGDLEKFLKGFKERNQQVKMDVLLGAAEQVAQALYSLKQLGAEYVHGNIRCRNVLVFHHSAAERRITVKLADPGLSSTIADDTVRLPWYPVECYNSRSLPQFTQESDIYMYGMTLLEIFYLGKHPYRKLSKNNLKSIIQEKDTTKLSTTKTAIPPRILNIHWGCVAENPGERFSPQECLRALQERADDDTDYCNTEDGVAAYTMIGLGDEASITSCELSGVEEDNGNGRQLGSGHFGTVTRGWYNSQQVAIKKINNAQNCTKEARDEFKREYLVMTKLKHKHVVQMLGKVTRRGNIWIVMELMVESLASHLKKEKDKSRMTGRKMRRLAKEICLGMEYLHDSKIIHRDLAARNILLDDTGTAKVSDFGLARLIEDDSDYYRTNPTKTNQALPIHWYPPENLVPRSEFNKLKYTFKVDIWSYAITLYEIFTYGASPNLMGQGTNDMVKFKQMLVEGNRLIIPHEVPVDLQNLTKEAWRTDPHERPTFTEIRKRYFATSDKSMGQHAMVPEGVSSLPVNGNFVSDGATASASGDSASVPILVPCLPSLNLGSLPPLPP